MALHGKEVVVVPLYCGMFKNPPFKVAAPVTPVVVKLNAVCPPKPANVYVGIFK